MRRSTFVRIVVVVAAAGAAVGLTGCAGERVSQAAAAAPLPSVSVVRAQTGTIEAVLELSGNLVPETRVDIRSKMPGTLDKVLVQIGDRVTEGQILATLDRREIDAQVDAAAAAVAVVRAGVDAADAALQNAAQEVERARNLYEKGALPKQRLDAAETQWRAARAQRDLATANVEQASATLRRAREVERDATLRAPMTGVVVARNYDAGSLIGPGTDKPVLAVADLRVLKLEAGVSELDAGRLKVGAAARLTLPALPGETFDGRVAALAPEVDTRNRHFLVDIRVANPHASLLGGMYATARLVTGTSEGILVPREAVFDRQGSRAVYRVEGDTVRVVAVSEGLNDGKRVALVSGLSAGDAVVADARREVAEGARVRVIQSN
jgi:RND family efflux transporter MFP subunit